MYDAAKPKTFRPNIFHLLGVTAIGVAVSRAYTATRNKKGLRGIREDLPLIVGYTSTGLSFVTIGGWAFIGLIIAMRELQPGKTTQKRRQPAIWLLVLSLIALAATFVVYSVNS